MKSKKVLTQFLIDEFWGGWLPRINSTVTSTIGLVLLVVVVGLESRFPQLNHRYPGSRPLWVKVIMLGEVVFPLLSLMASLRNLVLAADVRNIVYTAESRNLSRLNVVGLCLTIALWAAFILVNR